MSIRTLQTRTEISAPIEDVFAFFSAADNLQTLTPEFLHFQILTQLPIEMHPGTLIDYRLRLFGVPFRWRTEITVWEPGRRFVDVQRKGPYKLWEHEHRFTAAGETTLMEDTLRYEAPGGLLEPLIFHLFVGPQVRRVFDYRTAAISKIFPK